MNIGLIGLGRMGLGVAHRLIKSNFNVYGFDKDENACKNFLEIGGKSCTSIKEVLQNCNKIWLMVPAGKIVDLVLQEIISVDGFEHLIIIDGGNSFFKDSVKRAQELEKNNIDFLDCGTSGGLHGEQIGYCLMVGGKQKAYQECKEIFKAVATENGYAYVGPSGAGHYVKMVHNGIEYALLQSYAEGFELLKFGNYKNLNLEEISNLWNHGSIIRSWILDLTNNVFEKNYDFEKVSGKIGGGQTGTWTSNNAKENKVPVPMIDESLKIREWSQQTGGNFSTKLVALLRLEFGGHKFDLK